jgi:O-antigen/teichoic acid export membrane protein
MENIPSSFLTKTKNIQRSAVIWNAVAACLTSFQSMLLLMLLTHFGTPEHSGYFVMAFTAANLFMHLGKFGMRQYQVTDAGGKYAFRDYVTSRGFSVGLMTAALVLFLLWSLLFNGYTAEKAVVVALITFYRGVEAAEDVLHGRLQQRGRLDIAAKILAIRNAVFMAGFAALYLLTKNLILTCAVNAAVTLLLCVMLNKPFYQAEREGQSLLFQNGKASPGEASPPTQRPAARLLLECLPLCLTMVTYMYLGNAPKYIVDGLVSDEVQTRFNIVIMPAFVGSLLCSFIFNPALKRIGDLWNDQDIPTLRKTTLRLVLVPVAVDAVLLLGGWFLGIPVLSAVYGVDLTDYRLTLMIFLLASGAVAMLNLFVALLTAMRKQKHLLLAYAAASLLLLLAGRPFFNAKGLNPLCWFYLAVLLGVLAWCVGVYWVTVKKTEESV